MDPITQTTHTNDLYRYEVSDVCYEYNEHVVCCYACFEEVEPASIAVVSGRIVCTDCDCCTGKK